VKVQAFAYFLKGSSATTSEDYGQNSRKSIHAGFEN
jgi:hypothetical protein